MLAQPRNCAVRLSKRDQIMKSITALVAGAVLLGCTAIASAQTKPSERTPAGTDSTQHTQGAPSTNMSPNAGTSTANPVRPSERGPAGTDSTQRTQGINTNSAPPSTNSPTSPFRPSRRYTAPHWEAAWSSRSRRTCASSRATPGSACRSSAWASFPAPAAPTVYPPSSAAPGPSG